MLTRMPRFGAANLAPLIAAFAALDPLEPVAVPTFTESPRRVKSLGRFLAGGEALGCIKCHTFKGIESEGVQAVDMAVMTRRLRRDWFHRYLVDTQAYRPGTRMPTGWPGGKTMLPQVARRRHAKADRGASGSSSPTAPTPTEPYGLGREPMPLVPETEADHLSQLHQGSRATGHRRRLSRAREPGLRRQRTAARPDLARGVHRRLAALVGPRRRLPAAAGRQRPDTGRGPGLRRLDDQASTNPGPGAPPRSSGDTLPRLPPDPETAGPRSSTRSDAIQVDDSRTRRRAKPEGRQPPADADGRPEARRTRPRDRSCTARSPPDRSSRWATAGTPSTASGSSGFEADGRAPRPHVGRQGPSCWCRSGYDEIKVVQDYVW